MWRSLAILPLFLIATGSPTDSAEPLAGFVPSAERQERVRWLRGEAGIRIFVNLPANWEASARRHLVIFATPNGNTIEQTLGCALKPSLDWRYDIQHVAAQVRTAREKDPSQSYALAVVQAPQLSWPTYRSSVPRAQFIMRELVESLQKELSANSLTLMAHSGGGSFITGYLNAHEELPRSLQRIVYLDANYSYSAAEHHGEKLLAWLKADHEHRLMVIAYDDREITFNGKKVVGPDGGTFRATNRMQKRFASDITLQESSVGAFRRISSEDQRLVLLVHPNPDNKILHTALVGEMNGVLHGLLWGTPVAEKWGKFGGPRAYQDYVPPESFVEPVEVRAVIDRGDAARSLTLPERPADVPTGSQFLQQVLMLSRQEREASILREIMQGNVPAFERKLTPLRLTFQSDDGAKHSAVYYVTSDYLAIGTDTDFVRMPMTPATAVTISRAAHAALITRKISDDVFSAAEVKLQPQPMTKDRDAAATFGEHHRLIEKQRGETPPEKLIVGIKKDVVLTNRLREKSHKVAIYGWHYPHGAPIQSLYVGHVDWYVDYSHGVRLMADEMLIDGQPHKVAEVLKHPEWHKLLSDEGPIDTAEVIQAAQWLP